jgi:hypothetical protein
VPNGGAMSIQIPNWARPSGWHFPLGRGSGIDNAWLRQPMRCRPERTETLQHHSESKPPESGSQGTVWLRTSPETTPGPDLTIDVGVTSVRQAPSCRNIESSTGMCWSPKNSSTHRLLLSGHPLAGTIQSESTQQRGEHTDAKVQGCFDLFILSGHLKSGHTWTPPTRPTGR